MCSICFQQPLRFRSKDHTLCTKYGLLLLRVIYLAFIISKAWRPNETVVFGSTILQFVRTIFSNNTATTTLISTMAFTWHLTFFLWTTHLFEFHMPNPLPSKAAARWWRRQKRRQRRRLPRHCCLERQQIIQRFVHNATISVKQQCSRGRAIASDQDSQVRTCGAVCRANLEIGVHKAVQNV